MRWCVPAAAWLLCDLLIVLAVRDVGPKRGLMIAAAGMLLALTLAAAVVLLAQRAALAITLAAVAFAALASYATVRAPEHQVKAAFHAHLRGMAERDAKQVCAAQEPEEREEHCDNSLQLRMDTWREDRYDRDWVNYDIVNVEIDGDTARATLRDGPCTFQIFESEFRRDADGRWWYSGLAPVAAVGYSRPYCYEPNVEPPALRRSG